MNQTKISYPIKDRWSYLWLAIGTLLGFFWSIPLTMWVAPIFILRFVRTQKVWLGILLAWLTNYVVIAITFQQFLPLPLPVYLVTMLITSLMGTLPLLADRLLTPRLGGFLATLIYPLAVTAFDFFGAISNPMGSIGAQAYVQYGNLALMQLLSITGMWGIVFLVNWLGAVFNWAWERSFDLSTIRRGVVVYAGVMLLVVVYGGVRLAFAPEPTSTVRMHGITEVDMRQTLESIHQAMSQDWQEFRRMSAEIQDLYLESSLEQAKNGAQVIHWPEMAVFVAKEDEAAFLERAKQIARDQGVYLVMGMAIEFEGGAEMWENKLIVVDPSGEIVLNHDKYGNYADEGYKPGDGILRTFETPYGTMSGIICNDTNHQEIVAQSGRNGTQILFAPSMEYRGIDPMHAHMAAYRAVENGITLVRQADNGLSIVVDPYGRILTSVDHFVPGERLMIAQVPVYESVPTLYSYSPDLFGWLAIVAFLTLMVVAVVQGRKAKQAVTVQPEPQTAS